MTSREQFEEIFRKAYPDIPQSHKDTMLEWYNHGTDDEPEWGYYSLLARQAFEWWELSREAMEVEIDNHTEFEIEHMICPDKDGYSVGWIDGRNYAVKQVRAAGIKVKGE